MGGLEPAFWYIDQPGLPVIIPESAIYSHNMDDGKAREG
jgi:hypothetical protein